VWGIGDRATAFSRNREHLAREKFAFALRAERLRSCVLDVPAAE